MILDGSKYTESGYIGEELIGDESQQLLQRCLAVQQSIRDRDFASYEETIKAYNVSYDKYIMFLNKSTI